MSGPQLDIDAIEARTVQVGVIAQLIRRIDGEHSMGAGALAEALFDHGVRAVTPTPQDERPKATTPVSDARASGGSFQKMRDPYRPVTSTPEAATHGGGGAILTSGTATLVTGSGLQRATEQQQ